jgi:putative transposase
MQPHKTFYQKRLPHFQPQEETFFITYRLANSIPIGKIKELNELFEIAKRKSKSEEEIYIEQKRHFGLTDDYLNKSKNEPYWLNQNDIAKEVANSLHFCDEKFYKLWSFCIMPNHVHLVVTILKDGLPLYAIMQKHKRHTAYICNKLLKRNGQFWAHESYDHVVRKNNEFERILSTWLIIL